MAIDGVNNVNGKDNYTVSGGGASPTTGRNSSS